MWKIVLEKEDLLMLAVGAGVGTLVGLYIAHKMIQRYIKKEFGVKL